MPRPRNPSAASLNEFKQFAGPCTNPPSFRTPRSGDPESILILLEGMEINMDCGFACDEAAGAPE